MSNYKHAWNEWKGTKPKKYKEVSGNFGTEKYKTKMKGSVDGINRKTEAREERICELENRTIEIS